MKITRKMKQVIPMLTRLFYIPTLLFLFLNCASQAQHGSFSSTSTEPSIGLDTIIVKQKEATSFFNEEFSLRIEAIEQDGRCPTDVDCVWGGNAKIKFELTRQQNKKYYFVLNSNSRFTRDTIMEGISIHLFDLQPERRRNTRLTTHDYRAYIITNKVKKPLQDTIQLVDASTFAEKKNPFIGVWGTSLSPIIIGDAGEEGYYTYFGGDAGFLKTDVNPDSIIGFNSSGNFKIKMISTNPPQFLYSDDGLGGHFEPLVNVLYKKLTSAYARLLVGKWQNIQDRGISIEYTRYDLTNYLNDTLVSKEPYIISNKCMNNAEVNRPISKEHEYISVVENDMSWEIVDLSENVLVIKDLTTEEIISYRKIK